MRLLVFLSEIRQCVKASGHSTAMRRVKCQAGKEGKPLLGALVTSLLFQVSQAPVTEFQSGLFCLFDVLDQGKRSAEEVIVYIGWP